MFQQPTAGSDFKAADHIGHLLLIYVRELRQGIVTTFGTSDAISCDVVVLTDPAGPRCEEQVLLFQKPLIGSLKNSIGRDPVLARLGQGTAKPGQSAPYILMPFNEQDAAFTTQWLASVGNAPFQAAPALQQPAPVATVPQTVPLPQPVAPAIASAPMPQAPGVPAQAPQWAAPVPQAPVAAVPVPQAAPNAAEVAAAMAALNMQAPPPAPVG